MLVTIARYSFPYEAQIARSRLEAEGIPAYLADELTINMQWLYSDALGGIRLQVPELCAEEAKALLCLDLEQALVKQEGWSGDCCPRCSSSNTEPYQFGRRIAFLIFIGLEFPLFPTTDGIRCRDCGAKSKVDV